MSEQAHIQVNFDDFYLATFANYKKCRCPNRKPDFISKYYNLISSRYWYGIDSIGEYVIRSSDHWGNVASCRWLLNGSTENYRKAQSGKCYLKNFKKR